MIKFTITSGVCHYFVYQQNILMYVYMWTNRSEGDYWGDLCVDGWIILGWISSWDVGIWTGLG